MLRFKVSATLTNAIRCPNCSRVLRNIRARRGARGEVACDCGAIITLADVVKDAHPAGVAPIVARRHSG